MRIEFDPDKNARNIAARGVSLAAGEILLTGFVVERIDERRDYGEIRIGSREFVCVYTRRGDVVRPISLRRANRKERDVYQQAKAERDAGA